MKNILGILRVSFVATLILTVALGVIYPSLVLGVSQIFFSEKANGSLILKEGKVLGSSLIGQKFSSPKYFYSRPSAAGKGYDAANSSGSNLGPISAKLLNGGSDEGLTQRVQAYRALNGLTPEVKIPADAVTASASGLDPHISPRNAELQLTRVARERGLSEDVVRKLIAQNTDRPDWGLLGEAGVNVVQVNLALDAIGAKTED
jgi:potassium-transporting ATPase KdpC subunit